MTTDTTDQMTGETYTHAAWVQWAEASVTRLTALHEQLDTMAAQVGDDDGDKAQIETIRAWQSEIEAVIASGRRMIDDTNATQRPVGEAVAQAGGPDNTPHKEYADEARSGL